MVIAPINLLRIWVLIWRANAFVMMMSRREASCQEIVRRYYQSWNRMVKDEATKQEVYILELLMKQAKVSIHDRQVVTVAKQVAEERNCAVIALELDDGSVVTGKTTNLLGPASAVLLNAIKALAKIPDETHLISPTYINPVQNLKIKFWVVKIHACIWMKC